MAGACPVCELVNDDAALECERCGRQLVGEAELEETIEPVPGLDPGSHRDLTEVVPVEPLLPGLEQTVRPPAPLGVVEYVEVDPTRLDEVVADPAPLPLGFEVGRALDDGQRTAAPDATVVCPWCGSPSQGRICDVCGRRKTRYTAEAAVREGAAGRVEQDTSMCPNCFGRVPWLGRCGECGMPLPPRELL